MCWVWLNNVCELVNVVELFVVGVLLFVEMVNLLMYIGELMLLDQWVEDVEWQIIIEVLNIYQGCINEVVEYLLILCKKFYFRMKKYGLNKEYYKGVQGILLDDG